MGHQGYFRVVRVEHVHSLYKHKETQHRDVQKHIHKQNAAQYLPPYHLFSSHTDNTYAPSIIPGEKLYHLHTQTDKKIPHFV